MSPEEFRAQNFETTFFGPVNVTRAAPPVMRAQRSGRVVADASTAGFEGGEFSQVPTPLRSSGSRAGWSRWPRRLRRSEYARCWSSPGFFRTEPLTPESTTYAVSTIEDYAERTEQTVTAWKAMNGQQGGDPAKLADALVHLAGQDVPPLRFAAGADAVAAFERKANNLLGQGLCPPRPASSLRPRFGLSHVQFSVRSRLSSHSSSLKTGSIMDHPRYGGLAQARQARLELPA